MFKVKNFNYSVNNITYDLKYFKKKMFLYNMISIFLDVKLVEFYGMYSIINILITKTNVV